MNGRFLQKCLIMLIVLLLNLVSINGFSQSVWDGTSTDVTWYGNGSATEFNVSTASELAGLALLVNNGTTTFSGKTVKLNSDIWLNENQSTSNNWTPIGGNPTATGEFPGTSSPNRFFEGTFDGNNHFIYNLYCNKESYFQAGLFGAIKGSGATIKNVVMKNPYVKAKGMAGAIVGSVGDNSTGVSIYIQNCMAINAEIRTSQSSGNDNVGGIVGGLWPNGNKTGGNTYIQHCAVIGTIYGQNIGGIAGNGNRGQYSNCYFAGTLSNTGGTGDIGGIAGAAANYPVYTNCYSTRSGGSKNGTQRTEAQMKETSFITDLNKNGEFYKMDECSANGGFPLLVTYPCIVKIKSTKNEVCAGDVVTLIASYGLDTYEWKADGEVIPGATNDTIEVVVNSTTVYTVSSTRTQDNLKIYGENYTVQTLSNFNMTWDVEAYDGEEHGAIQLSSETIPCIDPQPINYTITPDNGWYVIEVLVDGEEVQFVEDENNVVTGIYTPTAGKHGNITAHFYDKYEIELKVTLNGNQFSSSTLVTPWVTGGIKEVTKGGELEYTISQTAIYAVNTIKINGSPIATAGTYKFEDVQANQKIEVDYKVVAELGKVWNGTQDITWYNTIDTEYYIYTPEQLAGLAKLVKEGTSDFAGKTIYLMSDMWLNEDEDNTNNWQPIGGATAATTAGSETSGSPKYFKGKFYGNEHIVYNMYCDRESNYHAGLFGAVQSGAEITYLGMVNPIVKSYGMMGAIVGYINSGNLTINNCMVINANIEGTGGNNIGSIVGATYNAGTVTVSNCLGTGIISGNYVGGIAGNGAKVTMLNTYFYGELTNTSGNSNVGGLTSTGGTITNSYTNEEKGSGATPTAVLTLEEMQTPDFLTMLNTGTTPAYRMDCNINQGLPIMNWYICIDGKTETCSGQEVVLSVVGDFDSYTWSTGDFDQEIKVYPTENTRYKVTVTSGNATFTGFHDVAVYDQLVISSTIIPYEDGNVYGNVMPENTNASCDYTDDVTITITPDEGWHVSSILLNGIIQNIPQPGANDVVEFMFTPAVVLNDIEIELLPYCERIANLTVVEAGIGSAEISWEAGKIGDIAEYIVEYSIAGENNWTVKTTQNTSLIISGLASDTGYELRVKTNCDQNSSIYVESSFSTNCEQGANNIAIGDGTEKSIEMPVNNYYGRTYTQQIYTAEEMNYTGNLLGIGFQYAYSSPSNRKNNVKIYLVNTSKSTFINNTDYIPNTELTEVYSGHLNCSNGWNYFTFDNPFYYNGVDNLAVVVYDNSGAYNSSSYKFFVHNTTDNKTLYYRTDGGLNAVSPPSATGRPTQRNNVEFITCASNVVCPMPDLYITEVTPIWGTVEFANNSTGSIELQYKKSQDTNWIPITLNDGETSKTILGLDPETTYDVMLTADCGEDGLSTSVKKSFTTLELLDCDLAGNIGVTVTTTTASITWDEGNATSWEVEYKAADEIDWINKGIINVAEIQLDELIHNTDYIVRMKSICTYNQSDWIEKPFRTYEECDFPVNIDIVVTTTTTLIEWEGGNGTSWNVEYKVSNETDWINAGVVDETNIMIYNLIPATIYNVRIKANCPDTESEWIENSFTTMDPDACDFPINIQTIVTTNSVSLTWEGGNAESWKVEYRQTNSPEWIIIGNTDVESLEILGLAQNTNYVVRIKSICEFNESKWSDELFTTYEECDLVANIETTATTTTAFVTWNRGNAVSWEVEYKVADATDWISVGSVNTASIQLDQLTHNTNYIVRVKAICTNTESEWVEESFTTLEECDLPADINIVVTTTTASITWESGNATSWNFEYKVSNSTEWINKGTVTVSEMLLEGLNHNTNYIVRIKAVCAETESGLVEKPFRTLEECDLVANVETVTTATTATITWNGGNATSWNFEYKTSNATEWINKGTVTVAKVQLEDLVPSTIYNIRVKAICTATESNWVENGFTTNDPNACASPANIQTAVTTNSATITWEGGNAESWKVEYKKITDVSWTALNDATQATAAISGLVHNTNYVVRIKAICELNESGWIEKTFKTYEECNIPINIEVTPESTTAFIIWDGGNATSWNIEYKKSSESNWTAVEETFINSRTLENLSSSTSYMVRIKATCANTESGWTANKTFTTLEVCNSPIITNKNVTKTGATISWNANGASKWTLEYKKDDISVAVWEAKNNITTTSTSISGLEPSTKYLFRIKAICTNFESEWTENNFTTSDPDACNAPTNLAATATTNSVSLTWTSNAGNWEIEYKKVSAQNWTFADNRTVSNLVINNLDHNTDYIVRVKSICEFNESNWAEKTFTTIENCSAPTSIVATTVGTTTAAIKWNANGGTSWEVQYKKSSASTWTNAGNVNTSSVTLTGLSADTEYNTRIKVACNNPVNDWVTGASFRTLEICNDPTAITATSVGTTNATITWTANGGTSWEVQYKKVSAASWTSAGTASTATMPLTGLSDNTEYNVQVKVVCNNPDNKWINGTSFRTLEICNAPTNIVVEAGTTTAIVKWDANGGTNWEFAYKKVSDTEWSATEVLTSETKKLTGLTNNTDYEVRVKVVCNNPVNNWVTKAFKTELIPCDNPTNLKANVEGVTVVLTWLGNAKSWDVEYRKVSDTEWTSAGNVTATTKTLTDLEPKTEYIARVKAICEDDESDWTNVEFETEMVGIDIVLENNLKVYPNPAVDFVDVKIDENTISTINIYDVNGKLIEEMNPNSSNAKINIENFARGTYLLHIKIDNDVIIKKIVKE